MAKVKVYRVGKLSAGSHSDELKTYWGAIDALKPSHLPTGRLEAIYASPNAYGMHRWLRSAIMMRDTIEIHEIIVESDNVYCYEIPAYDRIPTYGITSQRFLDTTEGFWKTGKTLTEWFNASTVEDGKNIEILINPDDIIETKVLSYRSVLNKVRKVAEWASEMEYVRMHKAYFAEAA